MSIQILPHNKKMKLKNRNGVLGLETAKQVMITFLILAVTGVAIILSLTALDDSIGDSVDNQVNGVSVINESAETDTVYANTTGYTLSGYNASWSGITITALYNSSSDTPEGGGWNRSVPTANGSVSALGVLTNGTTIEYSNISVSYDYANTYDTQKVTNIVGNVSGGLETFFASTGTIFSILIVVVIILAISIIIWAIGRFGQETEGTVNL